MGWRYLNFTLGGFTLIMASLRFFVVPLFESPRYLLGRGRDAEAVEVVNKIAEINGVAAPISLQDLQASDHDQHLPLGVKGTASYLAQCIASLFFPTRMAISTVLLILLWSKSDPFPCWTILTLAQVPSDWQPHSTTASCLICEIGFPS